MSLISGNHSTIREDWQSVEKIRQSVGSSQVSFSLTEQRKGWSLMIFCAECARSMRAIKGRLGHSLKRGLEKIERRFDESMW